MAARGGVRGVRGTRASTRGIRGTTRTGMRASCFPLDARVNLQVSTTATRGRSGSNDVGLTGLPTKVPTTTGGRSSTVTSTRGLSRRT
jgi:hypothetical protein